MTTWKVVCVTLTRRLSVRCSRYDHHRYSTYAQITIDFIQITVGGVLNVKLKHYRPLPKLILPIFGWWGRGHWLCPGEGKIDPYTLEHDLKIILPTFQTIFNRKKYKIFCSGHTAGVKGKRRGLEPPLPTPNKIACSSEVIEQFEHYTSHMIISQKLANFHLDDVCFFGIRIKIAKY